MGQIVNLVPTTELEAVNAMLAAIGEAPIAQPELDSPTLSDVSTAINLLRNSAREVQSMGWRFNTEFGFRIKPATTYDWVDLDGVHTMLNIFTPPANMLKFRVTPIPEQQGSSKLDIVQRPSRKYLSAGQPVLVFYDRILNRDGFDVNDANRASIWIDPVWGFNFEHLPEEARRFIHVRAGRQFIQQSVGSDKLAGFAEGDERFALRVLKREHGEEDDHNMLQNGDAQRILGWRPWAPGAVLIDPARKSNG